MSSVRRPGGPLPVGEATRLAVAGILPVNPPERRRDARGTRTIAPARTVVSNVIPVEPNELRRGPDCPILAD
jgi:hypothetical protein